ncbi:hypothetical protein DFP72DRAFT_1081654 [Ephemerocybe angulata]|uniref:Uncharacterized protein n=1 Tax=Ephemerocybe angulata TaxID=980116 RepID=A0A8H6H959_9AGAR|nr:hypothetical protein DFP72DRAFT_1081654 [Tulosesus angulatus]
MNANKTAQSHPQAPAPGRETRERTPTPAELIARLNEQNQTLSLATIMEYEQSPDLFRRALRDIPSLKSLNPGPNNYITDWEIKAFLAKVTRELKRQVREEGASGDKAKLAHQASLNK